jgi:hypothetical protein
LTGVSEARSASKMGSIEVLDNQPPMIHEMAEIKEMKVIK